MNKDIQEYYVWIISGKQRRTIIKAMTKPYTASILKEKTKIKITNISDILREMVNKGLAEVINPTSKRNRVYELTKLGEEVKKEIDEINI